MSVPTIISNFILYNVWGISMNFLLTRRFSKLKTFLLLQPIIVFIMYAPLVLPYLSVWRALLGLVTWYCPFILYRDKISKKFLVFALCSLSTMLVELWISVLLPSDVIAAGISAQPTVYQFGIYAIFNASVAVLLTLGTLGIQHFETKYEDNFSFRHWLGFALFPVSQYALLCGWFTESAVTAFSYSKLFYMLTVELICIAADVVLYYSMVSVARRSRLAAENELLKKQIDAQKAHYAALTDQFEDIRRMRHDIANHIYTINLLLKEGRADEAAAYAAELDKEATFYPKIGQCRNPVTDAFLYSRSKELESQGVEVEMKIDVPRVPQVSNLHMVSALGNLLDNAAEAALHCDKPWIKLNAYSAKGYLIIQVTNPIPPQQEKKRRIPELPRGVGTHILGEIAEIYSGEYTCSESDGVFLASLTLREENKNAENGDM